MKTRLAAFAIAGLCLAASASAMATNQTSFSNSRIYSARDAASGMSALSRRISGTFGRGLQPSATDGRRNELSPLTVGDITDGVRGSARGTTGQPGRHFVSPRRSGNGRARRGKR